MENQKGTRVISVKLPDDLIKKIAAELGIRDVARIPQNLIISSLDESTAKRIGVPSRGRVPIVTVVP